jgi:hypothetical protein
LSHAKPPDNFVAAADERHVRVYLQLILPAQTDARLNGLCEPTVVVFRKGAMPLRGAALTMEYL